MMAENEGMLYMPRLLTVMLPAYIAPLSRPYSILLRKQFPLLALADQLLHLLVETQQTRLVDVMQHGSDQAIGHRDSYVDIDGLVVTHHVVDVAAIHLRHLRHTPSGAQHHAAPLRTTLR